MLYWVPRLLLPNMPRLTHTHTVGKPTPTRPRDPSVTQVFGSPLKRKGFYLCCSVVSSGTRGSRSLQAWSQNSTTCLCVGQPVSCAVAMLEGDTGRAWLSEAACSAQTWHWPHTQLLLPVLVKVPRLDTVKYPRVRGKPQWFSSCSCYTICTVEKSLSR